MKRQLIGSIAILTAVLAVAQAADKKPTKATASASSKVSTVTSNGMINITTTIVTNGVPFTTTISTNFTDGNVSVTIQSSGGPGDVKVFSSSSTGNALNMPAPAAGGPVTWLGVAADEVSDDVRAQLPLDDGVGLIVRHVSQDSPAAKAGIQENDILTKFDDQILMNRPQLRQLVTNKKDGDTVKLVVLRKGKEIRFSAKLIQKELSAEESASQVIDLGGFNLDLNKMLGELKAHGTPIILPKDLNMMFGTNITHSFSFSTNITHSSGSSQIIIKQVPGSCPPKSK